MQSIEVIVFWCTIFSYTLIFGLHLYGFVTQRQRLANLAYRLLWGAFALHTLTGITHWIASGHAPVTGTYELNLTGTWCTTLIFLGFVSVRRLDKTIGLVVVPIVFLVLGHGYVAGIEINPLGTAFQSPWLAVHVLFAWLAFGGYAVATGASALLLLKMQFSASERLRKLPPSEELDQTAYRFVVLGFINHSIMVVSGAIWAKKLWGHYWSWDPLETWSLISFLAYAMYLHTRSFFKWKMQRAAWLAIACLIVLAISFWGVDWFAPSIHPGP